MTTMDRPVPFTVPGFTIAYFSDADTVDVQRLMERCQDHFEIHEGQATPPDAAQEMLHTTPPNYDRDRILNLGVYRADGQLVGCLTTPPDYPEPGDWYIGLLLLDSAVRNQGLGGRLMEAFDAWVAANGGRRILISVVDDNIQGRRFWDRLGFVPIRRTEPRENGNKLQCLTEMARPTTPRATETPPLPPG